MSIGLRLKFIICLLPITTILFAQWEATELAQMPEAVSNHAVTAFELNDQSYIYSFSGIDSTKHFSGIHKRCYKYDFNSNNWNQLQELPTGNGRIAAGASVVKNRIYIIGGYEVFANGSEKSFDLVHVFDPSADTFLTDGMNIPLPIDDHVQAVWQDSLIYVISGWSNTSNVNNVQVFNPSNNEWMEASPVPSNPDYMVFGGSGVIIGDTIYYSGGARMGSTFPATRYFRKGAINPQNPLEIKWTGWMTNHARGYRMASAYLFDEPVWFGGSLTTYNYNGIAYNGTGGVAPLNRIISYKPVQNTFQEWEELGTSLMDFRGLGQVDSDSYILCGGMGVEQQVSDKTFLLSYLGTSSVEEHISETVVKIYPNPGNSIINISSKTAISSLEIFTLDGQEINRWSKLDTNVFSITIPKGILLVQIHLIDGSIIKRKIIGL
jgi:hypothetical protein